MAAIAADLVFLQAEPLYGRDQHLLMIFIGLVAVVLVIQAIAVLVLVIAAVGALTKVKAITGEFSDKALPLIGKVEGLMDDLTPKVGSIAENAREISYTLREKTAELGVTVSQLNETVAAANMRARGHVDHVNRIIGSAIETTEEIKDTVANGVRGPVRQLAGIVSGVRAGVDTFVTGGRRRAPRPQAAAAQQATHPTARPTVMIVEE